MKGDLFLGIDTSNYTTSLCLVKGDGSIFSEARRLLPVAENAVGLRQSDALFSHVKALPELLNTLFSAEGYTVERLAGVGYSARPRDKEGSYMPCFLAGKAVAEGISSALCIPLCDFSHQAGHIAAAAKTSGLWDNVGLMENGFISFHISGGTTEILLTKKCANSFQCEIVGGTNDLNAGQAIDRTGVAMGLSFPCGKAMDAMSLGSTKVFSESELRISVKDGYINLSGLENMAKKRIATGEPSADVSMFVFCYLAKALKVACLDVREKYQNLPVCFAGGVMSNTVIRRALSEIGNVYFAKPEYSCDNSYGIAFLTAQGLINKNETEANG